MNCSIAPSPVEQLDMEHTVQILLVDDHTLFRQPLGQRLNAEPGFFVCGEAGTADEALGLVRSLRPDVILMDIDMPGKDCFDAAGMMGATAPDTKIIFLSGFVEDHYIREALRVKARAYITKDETPETVIYAIQQVASGGVYFSPTVRSRIVIKSDGVELAEGPQSRISTLSPRELQILRYIVAGMNDAMMAAVMKRSPKTINNHVDRIMKKLDIHTRAALAVYAVRNGIM